MARREFDLRATRDGLLWQPWLAWGTTLAIAVSAVGYQIWYQIVLDPTRALALFWYECLTFGLLCPLVAGILLRQLLRLARSSHEAARQLDLLRTQETYLAGVIGSSADAIIGLDPDDRIIMWNQGAEEMFGYRLDEMRGQTPRMLLPPGDAGDAQWTAIKTALLQQGAAKNQGLIAWTRDGTQLPVDVTHTQVRDPSGRLLGSAAILRDVTQRVRHAEEERRHTQELAALYSVSTALNQSMVVEEAVSGALASLLQALEYDSARIFLLDPDTQQMSLVASHGYTHLLDLAEESTEPGQSPNNLVALTGRLWSTPDVTGDPQPAREDRDRPPRVACAAVPLTAHGRVIGVLNVAKTMIGPLKHSDLTLLSSMGAQIGTSIDNLRLAEEARRAGALSVLIQEMHHRIKNNLQTVADLLSLEMSTSPSPRARRSLRDSVTRIKSIAAVHELLSLEQFRLTDITELARKVCDISLRHLLHPDQVVRAEVNGPSIYLPSKQATALALVINELVSNALKHAFESDRPGNVTVTMDQDGTRVSVTIRDDGRGLGPDFSLNQHSGLGLQIVRTLVEKDLAGVLKVATDPEGGTVVTLTFFR